MNATTFAHPSQPAQITIAPASWKSALLHSANAAAAFYLAWCFPVLNWLTFLYAFSLIHLSEQPTARLSFRFGLLAGFLVFAPQLAWFYNIFGLVALCLWLVLAFFTAAFALLLQLWRTRFGARLLWLAAPILWTGLEFFRGELYFLRFSWLSVGYAFSERSGLLSTGILGVYGTGFLIFLVAALVYQSKRRSVLATGLVITALLSNLPASRSKSATHSSVHVAGIQLEFPPDLTIPKQLDRVRREHPTAEIFVLSEYSFDGPVPKHVREWCRQNRRYLIAGGKDETVPGNFYNTAFVVDSAGEIVFQHAKSVPIQFFKDGLPAPSQEVWRSPWGNIAIPVCYDLSYRRVTDNFVRRGAQAFIVPFMDVADWGAQQHNLHARIAPVRAREYGVPIFRVGSSGISQNIDSTGKVLAKRDFPGQEQIIAGTLILPQSARLPLDTWVAPICTALGLIFVILRVLEQFNFKKGKKGRIITS
jgi:apolipoprotein N-acyltransferase